MRIEINIPKEAAEALKKKAEELNHSRKSFIEYLLIEEAKRLEKCKKI